MTAPRNALLAIASAVLVLSTTPALAQKTVPGEKWRNTVSMEAMGMKMPGRTMEACVPVGKANEALARPQDNDSNCEMYDVKQSGNKFSGKMRCTGKQPMEGTIESESDGNRVKGKMSMTTGGQSMNMTYDGEKLGQACEAKDWSDYKAPVVAQPQMPDACAMMADNVRKGNVADTLTMYVGADAQCAKHASRKEFCSAVATPKAFAELSRREKGMASIRENRDNVTVQPLTLSLQACNLGTADAMRTRLLGVAEKDANWDFLVAEGNDATWTMLRQTAQRECSGRSFTSASNPRYLPLCRQYGMALTRGDREAALNAAGVFDSGPQTTSSAPASGSANAAAPAAPAEEAEPSGTDKAKAKTKDALDKGKKALRGIFGGGGN